MKKRVVAFISLILLIGTAVILVAAVGADAVFGASGEDRTADETPITRPVSEPTEEPWVIPNPWATIAPAPTPTVDPQIEQEKQSFRAKKVTGLTVKNTIQKKVKLTWDRTVSATSYDVYRSLKKTSGYKKIKTVRKKKFVDKTGKKRKTYYYKIKAKRTIAGTVVESGFSNRKKVYVQPANPTTVIVGECFAVALEREKSRLPSYFRYVAKAGMSTVTILNSNDFTYAGNRVSPLEKAASYKPDRIIFLVGANYSGSIDPTMSANLFVKMKKLMNKINPHVQFVIMAVSPWKKDSTYGHKLPSHEKRHLINAAYKKVAESHKDMFYCDLPVKMEDANGDLQGQFNGGDGLHWSGSARLWMVKNLKKWCLSKLGTW